MGKVVKSVGKAIGKVGGAILGKKEEQGGFAPETAEQQAMNRMAAQEAELSSKGKTSALELLGAERQRLEGTKPSEAIERANIARESAALGAGREDTLRSLQARMAQRGLGKSSIGLGQETSMRLQGAQQEASLRASLPERMKASRERLEAQKMGLAGQLASVGSGAQYQAAQYLGPKQKVRKGGFAPLLGAAVGAGLGGSEGAKIGMGIGQAAQSL